MLEISHACASATGCFPGDAPGYPVQITAEGSYRLTSDLVVPAGTNGVEVASFVDLDLNGFAIRGPVLCNPCMATGAGSGVVPALLGGAGCAVHDGAVRGFGLDGIALGAQSRVAEVSVSDVARHGVSLGGGSLVTGARVERVGGHGIVFASDALSAPSLYRDATLGSVGQVAALAGRSVSGGRASGPNLCIDRLCGTRGKPFFYLTTTTHLGAAADVACATGFRMASLWEIHDLSAVEYDTTRGRSGVDVGQGAYNGAYGWVRTGGNAEASGNAGFANCVGWSSSAGSDLGSAVRPNTDWASTGSGTAISAIPPWRPEIGAPQAGVPCNIARPVWCVQN